MILEFKPDKRGAVTSFPDGASFIGKLHIGDLAPTTDLTGFTVEKVGIHQVISVWVFNENPVWAMQYPPLTNPIPDVTIETSRLKRGVVFYLANLDEQDPPVDYTSGRLLTK